MPFPIIPIIVGAFAGRALSGIVSAVTKPGELLASYAMNCKFPCLLPGQGDAIMLYHEGLITQTDFRRLMCFNGCDLAPLDRLSGRGNWWDRMKLSGAAKIPLEMIRLLLAQRKISDEQAQRMFDLLGFANHPRRDAIFNVSTPMDLATLGVLINRGVIDDSEWDRRSQEVGFWDADDRNYLHELLKNIPGPADLVTFGVREGWDISAVTKFGYDQEFPPEFDYWMKKQGYGGSAAVADEKTTDGKDLTWAKIYWRAHWQTLAPTLAYEMVRRLRPTGGRNGGARDPSGEVFTPDDLKEVLKINDYPPAFRGKLFAINTVPIGVRESRQLYQYGLVNKGEVSELWQDQGHNKADSDLMADEVDWADQIRTFRSPHHLSPSTILDAYKTGAIDRSRAAAMLLSTLEVRKDVIMSLRGMGNEEAGAYALTFPYITSALLAADIELDLAALKVKIAAVRRRYLHGFMAEGDLRVWLESTGMDSGRVTYYISLFGFERRANLQVVSTDRVITFFKRGLVNYATAEQVLQNLGWQPLDRRLLLAEALQDLQTQQLRAAVAAEKDAERKAQKQAQLVKALQAEKERELKKLLASSTRGDLLKWMKKGLISPEEAAFRLEQLGMQPGDAALAIADAQTDAAGRPRPVPHPTGGGGGPTTTPQPRPVVPTKAELLRWMVKGLITEQQCLDRLVAQGLSPADATLEIEDALTPKPKVPVPLQTPEAP